MSTVSGDSPRNLQQQRKLAKDLLKAARADQADAIARLKKVRADAAQFKLADAQLAISREAGFDSPPKSRATYYRRASVADEVIVVYCCSIFSSSSLFPL